MNKEKIGALAKILTNIKTMVDELELARKNGDNAKMEAAKKNIMNFQKQIDKAL